MAYALRQQVDPSYLLQQSQWGPQGWQVVKQRVLRQIGVDSAGAIVVPTHGVVVDGFGWDDVQLFGVGSTDDAVARLQAEIQARGSDLYAYALLRRDAVNLFGFHFWSYRLVLVHSFIELAEFAVAILAIAFAVIFFYQYVTTGKSPAVGDLRNFFGGLITDAGQAAGQAGAGIAEPFVWLTIAGGVAALAFALAGKSASVKTRAPSTPKGSIGVRTGPVSGRIGS